MPLFYVHHYEHLKTVMFLANKNIEIAMLLAYIKNIILLSLCTSHNSNVLGVH